jgi:Holliday junction resolvase
VENQTAVGRFLSAVWCCSVGACPKAYAVDLVLHRGLDVVALVEVKCRTYMPPDRTLWISAHKWADLIRLSEATSVPAFLAVHFYGHGLYVIAASRRRFRTILGGRRDRGDAQDIEPEIEIPLSAFERVWASNVPGVVGK